MIAALDNLKEQSWTVFNWLCENLKEVALVIVVDEDLLALKDVDVLLHLYVDCAETSSKVIVICVRDFVQEHNTSRLHALHSVDDIFSAHRDVLYTWTSVVLAELLDLRLALASGRFIDWHLNLFIEICHHDRSQRRVSGVNHLVVDRPESVKIEHLLVPLRSGFHLTVLLVSDAMIDIKKIGHGHKSIQRLIQVMLFETRQEWTGVTITLHEGVDSVTIGFYTGHNDRAVLVGKCFWFSHACGTSRYGFIIDTGSIIYGKRHVTHAVTMFRVMCRKSRFIRVQRRLECERNLIVANYMGAEVSLASLETLSQTQNIQLENTQDQCKIRISQRQKCNMNLPGRRRSRIPCVQCRKTRLVWRCRPRNVCGRNRGMCQFRAAVKNGKLRHKACLLTRSVGRS